MKQPNFFIVGAPKSGTTALNEYLKQHPQIFIPEIKDVSFFGSDLHFISPRITREQYMQAFTGVANEERIGEASVWYLYSKRAAAEIKAFCPSASIIAMLRNPVDMLYAQHSEFLYNCNEDISDFATAIDAEEDRKRGLSIPRKAHLVEGLFYRETAKYGEQIERYFRMFGRENVHIIIYDDFKRDTQAVFKQTLQFLGVNPDFRPRLKIINPNKVVRSRRIMEFLVDPPQFLTSAYQAIAPQRLHGHFLIRLRRLNTRYRQRPPIDPDLRRRLQAEFRTEVECLSELLGRDLTGWCRE